MNWRIPGFTQLLLAGALPPKDHFSRYSWRKRNGDPVKYAVIARALILWDVLGALWLLAVLTINELSHHRLIAVGSMLAVAGVSLVVSIIASLFLLAYLGKSGDFFDAIYEACDLLEISPKDFSTVDGRRLSQMAKGKLQYLASTVLVQQITYNNPLDKHRVQALGAFEHAYRVFLQLGLIRNDGYDRYFPKRKRTLVVAVQGDYFGVNLEDGGLEPLWAGHVLDEAIGQFVRLHHIELGMDIRWSWDDETKHHVLRSYQHGGNPLKA